LKLFFRKRLDVPAQTQDDSCTRDFFFEQREDFIQSRQPRGGVKFQHQRRVVAVHHEAGPAVALAVNEPEAVCLRVKQIAADRKRVFQTRIPPGKINGLRLAGVQDADADRRA
jgi:hypothetical protein